ncbi:MAG TPA: ATP synthase F1 subunit epsilon [Anaerolineales bacterium]|nr:ATP synthase F1 subunit epsilon [Anaerolineales bacterium]HNC09530.1 ATP synthase F1 subunit epsilon [Anaerolineales bacterium]
MTIRCEIVSQDRTVFTGDVDIVVIPGAAGEMGILPKHAPVLTTLKFGVVKVRKNGKEELFTVAGGVAEIQPEVVTILADRGSENIEDIDVDRALAAKKRAEEYLAKGVPADLDRYEIMEAALRRANLRLDVVRRYRKGGSNFPHSES